MRRTTDLPSNDCSPFASLKRRERSRVANVGTQVTRPSGSVLATRGRVARQVVVILDGVATAFRDDAQERLVAGHQFGAIEIMSRAPHSETILADTSVLLWVLTIREFTTMLRDIPSLADWYASAPASDCITDAGEVEAPTADRPFRATARVNAPERFLTGVR